MSVAVVDQFAIRRRPRTVLAVLVVVVALVVVAVSGSPIDARPGGPADIRIVALGDSYVSGNGGGSYSGRVGCYRSNGNATARWASLLRAEGHRVTHTNAACSGARTDHIDDQIAEATAALASATHVVVGIGGNDAHFGDLVFQCLFQRDRTDCEDAVDDATALLPTLTQRVRANLVDIARSAPDATVVLLGYPLLVGEGRYRLPGYEAGNAIRTLGALADAAYRNVVRTLDEGDPGRFVFVSLHDTYDGHELAGRDEDWIRGIGRSFNRAEWVHPTESGYAATARLLASMSALVDGRWSARAGVELGLAAPRPAALRTRWSPTEALGDLDGDGFDDRVVATPDATVAGMADAGVVTIHPGGPGAGPPVMVHQGLDWFPENAELGDRFGESVAIVDIDGDGAGELVVGMPGEGLRGRSRVGAVAVIDGSVVRGTPAVAVRVHHQETGETPGSGESDDRWGATLSGLDVNGDGFGDLAVGAPGEDIGSADGTGAVTVLYGSPTGLRGATMVHQGSPGIPGDNEDGDGWGSVLASGDLDGDGDDELVIATPAESLATRAEVGTVTVAGGSISGFGAMGALVWHQGSAGVAGFDEPGDRWGSTLAVRDLDGDGSAELIVGAPDESIAGRPAAGAVTILFGAASAPIGRTVLWHQGSPGVAGPLEAGGRWGSILVTDDPDGDGAAALLVGRADLSVVWVPVD